MYIALKVGQLCSNVTDVIALRNLVKLVSSLMLYFICFLPFMVNKDYQLSFVKNA